MIFGNSEMTIILGVLLTLVISYVAYSLIKQLRTFEKTQARRILDLMVIGSILYWLDIFIPQERSSGIMIQATAGMLIYFE